MLIAMIQASDRKSQGYSPGDSVPLRGNDRMSQPMRDESPVSLFWTGGWDSTYRLLDLLLVKQKPVQPYYLIDTQRRSFGTEIQAMNAIKRRLAEKHPDRFPALRSTIFREVLDIPPDDEIHQSYLRICAQTHVGIQYDWAARFAHAEGLSEIEVSLIGGGHMFHVFEPYLDRRDIENDVVCEIGKTFEGTDIYRVFKYFRFPLIFMTKKEMFEKAEHHGFMEFMLMTRFCHTPRSDGSPCGVCIPCGIAIECGLGWRLSRGSRARFHLKRLYRKGRGILEHYPRVFVRGQKIARKLKRTKKKAPALT